MLKDPGMHLFVFGSAPLKVAMLVFGVTIECRVHHVDQLGHENSFHAHRSAGPERTAPLDTHSNMLIST